MVLLRSTRSLTRSSHGLGSLQNDDGLRRISQRYLRSSVIEVDAMSRLDTETRAVPAVRWMIWPVSRRPRSLRSSPWPWRGRSFAPDRSSFTMTTPTSWLSYSSPPRAEKRANGSRMRARVCRTSSNQRSPSKPGCRPPVYLIDPGFLSSGRSGPFPQGRPCSTFQYPACIAGVHWHHRRCGGHIRE